MEEICRLPDGWIFNIYTGKKPKYRHNKPRGRLLCKIDTIGKPGMVIDNGRAGCFIVLNNNKIMSNGSVGEFGCDCNISNIDLVKNNFITIDWCKFTFDTIASTSGEVTK